ncbi:unnamed protein product [Prorocentrum cordatum]|uniref:Uncharacterized protein n=1 Tax=Prorocentrum cordatum TaxID=2364126 RepID=A0ABN9XGD1_9DINO|nr:unnamed protein product [Polarella glacialis]
MGLPGGGGAALLPGGDRRLVEPMIKEAFDVSGKDCAACGCATWSPWRGQQQQQQQQMCVIGVVLHQWVTVAVTVSEGATSGSLGGAMGAQNGQELLRLLRGEGQPCQDIAHDVDGREAEQSVAPVDCSAVHVQESHVSNTGGARQGRAEDAAAQSQMQMQLVKAVRPIDMERMSGEVGDWWLMQGKDKRGRAAGRRRRCSRIARQRRGLQPRPCDKRTPRVPLLLEWCSGAGAAGWGGMWLLRRAAKKGKKAKQGAESDDAILCEAICVAKREAAELASAALVESLEAELVPVLDTIMAKLGGRAVFAALGRLRDGAQQALGQGSSTTLDEQEWGARFLDGEFAEDKDKAAWVQVVADTEDALGSDIDGSG